MKLSIACLMLILTLFLPPLSLAKKPEGLPGIKRGIWQKLKNLEDRVTELENNQHDSAFFILDSNNNPVGEGGPVGYDRNGVYTQILLPVLLPNQTTQYALVEISNTEFKPTLIGGVYFSEPDCKGEVYLQSADLPFAPALIGSIIIRDTSQPPNGIRNLYVFDSVDRVQVNYMSTYSPLTQCANSSGSSSLVPTTFVEDLGSVFPPPYRLCKAGEPC